MTTIPSKITLVEPCAHVLTALYPDFSLEVIEKAGRTCYKSEGKVASLSPENQVHAREVFIHNMIRRGHESVIEHATASCIFTCSRAASHQLVRHRLAAYSQESQRYCDYGKTGLQVICPPSIGIPPLGTYEYLHIGNAQMPSWYLTDPGPRQSLFSFCGHEEGATPSFDIIRCWMTSIHQSYQAYQCLRTQGVKPEDARFVLPNATKTEVFATFNFRVWRHIFKERTLNPRAQWEIRIITLQALEQLGRHFPVVFGDLLEKAQNMFQIESE